MPIILWSDYLVFMLLAFLIGGFVMAKNNVNIRHKWSKVYQHPSRIIALIVLSVFAVIAVLDSMHFIPSRVDASSNIRSVLDVLLDPISNTMERSYSAPFATMAFDKSMEKGANGEVVWIAEQLKHINPIPIWKALVFGFLYSALIMAIGTLLLWQHLAKRDKRINIKDPRFLTAWITTTVVVVIISVCYQLLQHYHILGTDKIGIDVFYSSVKSIRTGLIIGILTTVLTLPFAIVFGAMAGYFRGVIDDAIQYIYTTLSSIPAVLLIAAAMLSLDALLMRHADYFSTKEQMGDLRLLLLCAILGITSWTTLCRILRGETLKLRAQGFVVAAVAMGLNSTQIIRKHIVPNLMHIILISLILDFSGLVLAEAVLSYVGVGVDSSMFSWGNMINGARMEMGRDPIIWWSLVGAFIFMFILVLAANILADGVRDAFDPRMN